MVTIDRIVDVSTFGDHFQGNEGFNVSKCYALCPRYFQKDISPILFLNLDNYVVTMDEICHNIWWMAFKIR